MTGSIDAIYRQHRDGLFSLALSITGRSESAEDAVHDAVVRLYRANKTVTGDPVAYVFAAVRNAAIDQRRKIGPRGPAVSMFDMAAEVGVDRAEQQETADRVSSSLESLPADQREAVVLHLYAGLTFQQAAETIGVPLQTVASRYRRGLAGMKEMLVRDLKM